MFSCSSQTVGDKVNGREGNSPEEKLRTLSFNEVKKESRVENTIRRWAWKQPSFKESVKAH